MEGFLLEFMLQKQVEGLYSFWAESTARKYFQIKHCTGKGTRFCRGCCASRHSSATNFSPLQRQLGFQERQIVESSESGAGPQVRGFRVLLLLSHNFRRCAKPLCPCCLLSKSEADSSGMMNHWVYHKVLYFILFFSICSYRLTNPPLWQDSWNFWLSFKADILWIFNDMSRLSLSIYCWCILVVQVIVSAAGWLTKTGLPYLTAISLEGPNLIVALFEWHESPSAAAFCTKHVIEVSMW